MPFTLAHPAIVLPLNRSKGRFSLTALVSGSIVPDFEFFFQMKEVENIGHHWYGILLFDLPVAWAFCFLYHGLLRNAFLANLPAYFRNRFTGLSNFNWARFATANRLKITVSILIGIFTHIIWDEFTHADGVFLPVIPALSNAVKLGSTSLPVYYLLQILFSLFGMLFILLVINRIPLTREKQHLPGKSKYYWPLFTFVFTTILCARIAGWPEYNSFWGVVMACMGGFSYAWILNSLLITRLFTTKNKS